MQSVYRFMFLLVGTFAIIHLVQAQDQQGFISLDCGLSANEPSPYVEPYTRLRFTSDADYIQTGEIGRVEKELESNVLKPYATLRYFPNGLRNCYTLNVTKNTNYLIRAFFIYGNYDGLDKSPSFHLYLGPNFWKKISWYSNVAVTEEIMHIARSDTLQICLVKTDDTTPIISSLELRPFRNDTYITQSGSLSLLSRRFLGNSSNYIRHPQDAHDRQWLRYLDSEWRRINTSFDVNTSNTYDPPKAALMRAATPINASRALTFYLYPSVTNVYVNLHFAEIEAHNGTREFEIFWNGNSTGRTITPRWLQIDTINTLIPLKCHRFVCYLELMKTQRSTLPPLLNAIEAFEEIQFPQFETDRNDVAAIKTIQTTYGLSEISWQGDPCVPQKLMWNHLNCSYKDVSTPPRIISLNLSRSGLNGTIASSFQKLTLLQILDLSNNNLIGGVPKFLADMRSLMVIDLSRNNLSGYVPQALLERKQKGLKLILEENPNLCNSTSCTRKEKRNFMVPIVASVSSGATVAAVVLILVLVLRKKRASKTQAPQDVPSLAVTKYPSEPSILGQNKKFTYSEVVAMTKDFERVLGKGGFGFVYHGYVSNTEQVAVKMLSQSSAQGYKEFKAEVELLLRVHHVNLVSLVGYCDEENHLALVYEHMPNGDLKQHLSGRHDGGFVLSWASRLRIAVEAALGLEYLHTGCRPPMVHRDVKSTNILLDEHFHAKLADFGLSRSFPVGGGTHVSTVIAGTPGYVDPEYYQTNWLTEKSDVYSFGVVILEIITNRPVIEHSRVKAHIGDWVALMIIRGDIKTIIDPKLHGNYDFGSVWKTIEIAMSCVNSSSAERPDMSWVIQELKECLKSENSRIGGSKDMDSNSSVELSMKLNTEVYPKPR